MFNGVKNVPNFQGSMMIESLQNRIKELENELHTFRQIGESTQQVLSKSSGILLSKLTWHMIWN